MLRHWPCDAAGKGKANRSAVHARFGIFVIVCEAQEYAVASIVDAPPFVVDFRWTKNQS